MTQDAARAPRLLMRRSRAGVLGTFSTRFPGFPAGSAVPYAIDARGRPVLLISDLAAHTQNIRANAHTSLAVHQDDVVTDPRLCLFGEAIRIDPDEPGAVRYLALFPDAGQFAKFGDFGFYRIEPVGVHYIGGFGDIRWFDAAAYVLPSTPLEDREADIVDHMNDDHSAALHRYCIHEFGVDATDVRMLTVDGDGFDVRADGRLLRFGFDETVSDADAARRELVRLAQESRNE
ncbi:MAG: DUF2470 domain-containing protein [Betaproteobacteria bacterium]|nr:DUF2470 domain-containing protein [Betaproteobacteria bacterium]